MFEKFLKRTNWTDIAISILFVILGALLIIKPTEMMSVVSILLGMVLFIAGFLKIVDYFTSKDKEDYLLTLALVAVVIGVIVLFCSDVITGIFRVVLGIWIIASGIRNFQTALVWKEVKSKLWTTTTPSAPTSRAHCLAAQKGNAAVKAQLRCVEGGICAGDSCLCAFHFCVVGVRIDLVQGLARLHKGSLCEELFLQDAAHLGANLCLAEGRNAAGKLGCKGNVPGLDFEDGRVAHALLAC